MDEKAAEAEIVGTRVVNSLNVEMPSMRVGHNRCRVGRTLSETLGNEACYEAFWTKLPQWWEWDPEADLSAFDGRLDSTLHWLNFSFVRVNVGGVWFAVDDVPGWDYWLDGPEQPGNKRLNVYDANTGLVYRYMAKDDPTAFDKVSTGAQHAGVVDVCDYAFRTAKLQEVDAGDSTTWVRKYEYDTGDRLTRQHDSEGNEITYAYSFDDGHTNDNNYINGVTATGAGTRVIQASFGAPKYADQPSSRALLGVSCGTGNSWRQYEWNGYHTPLGSRDGKLKAIKDLEGNYLACLEYEGDWEEAHSQPIPSLKRRGRLLNWTRGPAGDPTQELVASFHWTEYLQHYGQPWIPSIMDAKFYTDATHYELIHRAFDKQGQVIQIDQYPALQPVEEGQANPVATTTFEYQVDSTGAPVIGPSYWNVTTLPGGQVARYEQYDPQQGTRLVELFLAPPWTGEAGSKVLPPGTGATTRRNWTSCQYIHGYTDTNENWHDYGAWQKDYETDHSSNGLLTDYEYDEYGYLTRRTDPEVNRVAGEPTQAVQERAFDPVDYRKVLGWGRSGPHGSIVTSTDYDDVGYGNLEEKTDTCGTSTMTWTYGCNIFGQQTREVDPDGYAHCKDFDPVTGLLTGTYTYTTAGATSGQIINQTKYEYQNGFLWKIHVADHEGAFDKDGPDGWIITEFDYDEYGRLETKTIGSYMTSYEYDRQDRLTKLTYPDGRWKEIKRDGRGQISRIEYHGTDGQVLVSTYKYDVAGNLETRTTQGCSECGPKTSYGYDIYNRRTSETREEVSQ